MVGTKTNKILILLTVFILFATLILQGCEKKGKTVKDNNSDVSTVSQNDGSQSSSTDASDYSVDTNTQKTSGQLNNSKDTDEWITNPKDCSSSDKTGSTTDFGKKTDDSSSSENSSQTSSKASLVSDRDVFN